MILTPRLIMELLVLKSILFKELLAAILDYCHFRSDATCMF